MERVLDISAGRVFYDGLFAEPMLDHPEGLAVHRDGSIWCGGERGQVYRIEAEGSAMEQVAQAEEGFSHGMAFDADDNLYICDLKHAAVMKLDTESGILERFADGADGRGIILCHPTNLAFRDNVLFTANLGRWHITAIQTATRGLPLYGGYGSER